MAFFETIAVAFAMYSAIPVPQPEWNQRNMRYALCAFPLVGVACGLLWWGWSVVCGVLGFPDLLRGAGFCLLPVMVTGGIHLDGYADTSDALSSHAPREKKLEILKDSHCGAFAAIKLCGYFTASWALCCTLRPSREAIWCVGLAFVLSRAMSGFAIAAFPLAKNTGLAYTFAAGADRRRAQVVLALTTAAAAAAMCWIGRAAGAGMVATAVLVYWHYYHTAKKQFGGITGDLAGWFLQRAEVWMLAALVLCQYAGGLG